MDHRDNGQTMWSEKLPRSFFDEHGRNSAHDGIWSQRLKHKSWQYKKTRNTETTEDGSFLSFESFFDRQKHTYHKVRRENATKNKILELLTGRNLTKHHPFLQESTKRKSQQQTSQPAKHRHLLSKHLWNKIQTPETQTMDLLRHLLTSRLNDNLRRHQHFSHHQQLTHCFRWRKWENRTA